MSVIVSLVVIHAGCLVAVFMLGLAFGWAVSLFKNFLGGGGDGSR